MELFKSNGHLTDEGLQALIDEKLNELQSLETAEHLGFCDECLVRYTNLLTDNLLLSPEEPLEKPVAKRIKNKKMHVFFKKASTIAAAAVIATGLWSAGLFSSFFSNKTEPSKTTAPVQSSQTIWGSIGHEFSSFFSQFDTRNAEPTQPSPPKNNLPNPTQSKPN